MPFMTNPNLFFLHNCHEIADLCIVMTSQCYLGPVLDMVSFNLVFLSNTGVLFQALFRRERKDGIQSDIFSYSICS